MHGFFWWFWMWHKTKIWKQGWKLYRQRIGRIHNKRSWRPLCCNWYSIPRKTRQSWWLQLRWWWWWWRWAEAGSWSPAALHADTILTDSCESRIQRCCEFGTYTWIYSYTSIPVSPAQSESVKQPQAWGSSMPLPPIMLSIMIISKKFWHNFWESATSTATSTDHEACSTHRSIQGTVGIGSTTFGRMKKDWINISISIENWDIIWG